MTDSLTIIVPTAPSGMMFPTLAFYLKDRAPKANIIIVPPDANGDYDQVPVMRNRIVNETLPWADSEWFVFLDNDLLPDTRLDPFWDAMGDVVGAEYTLKNPAAWSNPNTVHGGAMRIHRRVFAALPQPWFRYVYNEKHTAMTGCECLYFCRNVLNAGFAINRAGFTDHKNLRSYC